MLNECYDIHILSKAINIMSRYYAVTWRQSKLLYFSGILLTIKKIMGYAEMATTRESAILVWNLLNNPDDMLCWLKFGNDRLILNSACADDRYVKYGNPHRLPKNRGLYRDWGAFFDFGDVIEIPGGITAPNILMDKWSISFWVVLPLTLYET